MTSPILGALTQGADFSTDRAYRYRLWRTWDPQVKPLVYILLNPSKASESLNDPTITRCAIRAKELGYGGIVVVNLFALCATEPKVMLAHPEPIGRDNDEAIRTAAAEAGLIIAGWGSHGRHMDRAMHVQAQLRDAGYQLHHLGRTKDGHPKHPLYVGYAVKPQQL